MVLLLTNYLRTSNKKKKIIGNYNSSAPFYDKRYRLIQEEKYLKTLDNLFLKGKRILDAGCGTGLLFEFILKSGVFKRSISCHYVGLDISKKMLTEFKVKLLKSKIKANVFLILSDIENLPFRENIFNAIFSFTSFQNLPNYREGFQEIFRVALKYSDLKLSILKKKLEVTTLSTFLNPYLTDLEITNEERLEDIIIQGKISKP